jgi:hypothetical protein
MGVNLYQVLIPCLAKCWNNEVALLTNQEGKKVDKPLVKEYKSMESF